MKKNSVDILFDELGRAVWHCDYQGSYGNRFIGTFVFRPVLSAIEEIQVDRLYRRLLGDDGLSVVSPVIDRLAYSLASLKYRVLKSPPFWHDSKSYSSQAPQNEDIAYDIPGGHIDDAELIFYVYSAAIEAQLQYRERIKKQSEQSTEAIKKFVKNANSPSETQNEDLEAVKQIMEEKEVPQAVTKIYEVEESTTPS
jgi:hypothetical protein